MRIYSLTTLTALPLTLTLARGFQSIPEDPAAFPKFRVSYLNGLPILNSTAEIWLAEGLRGGEAEFLEQPWEEHDQQWARAPERKEIGAGEDAQHVLDASMTSGYRLEHMKLGPTLDFLCLIPPPLQPAEPDPSEVDAEETIDPIHAWSLLQPLQGGCLYHRQAWFTYAYCHNSHIRQFREAAHSHPHPPGGYVPKEDTEWEAYTLGQAPSTPPGTDVSVADRARAARVELARSAGPTYLVLRWGDGTVCDKNGRRRDVEIQFHCGMAGPDTILFVKETRTCSYVLVVHTPRLCSLPGFRAPPDTDRQAEIRCRQVVHALPPSGDLNLLAGDAPYPAMLPKKQPVLQPPPPKPVVDGKADSMKKLLDRIMSVQGGAHTAKTLQDAAVVTHDDDGTLIIELDEDLLADLGIDVDSAYGYGDEDYDVEGGGAEGYDYAQGDDNGENMAGVSLFEILKAAGYDVATETPSGMDKKKKKMKPEDEEERSHAVDGE